MRVDKVVLKIWPSHCRPKYELNETSEFVMITLYDHSLLVYLNNGFMNISFLIIAGLIVFRLSMDIYNKFVRPIANSNLLCFLFVLKINIDKI